MLLSLETCHKLNAALFGRPEVNQRISKAAHIKELNTEIDKLKEELFATREKNGVYLPADHWESQQVCLVAFHAALLSFWPYSTALSMLLGKLAFTLCGLKHVGQGYNDSMPKQSQTFSQIEVHS